MRILLITGSYPTKQMGGAEYQTALLGQGLVERGHTVGYLATNAGALSHNAINGMEVWEIPGYVQTGRKRHQQQLAETIAHFAPDLCYVRVFGEIGRVVKICRGAGLARSRQAGIPVVTVSCGPGETSPWLVGQHPKQALAHLLSGETLDYFCSFRAIGRADLHVCNSLAYTEVMQQWYPKHKVVTVYNGSPLPPEHEIHQEPSGQVIWVNNFKRAKRPELYIQLAQALPQFRFIMIGNRYGRYGDRLLQMIETGPPNLIYLGPLPVEQVNQQIAQSDLLVYTTGPGNEGFGNSYLQAWFRGVPTVSTFALDGLLDRKGIGRFAYNFGELVEQVQLLMTDHKLRLAMGARARTYAMQSHQVGMMVGNYEQLFTELVYTPQPLSAWQTVYGEIK